MFILYIPVLLSKEQWYKVGDNLKLEYYDLLSPEPIYIHNIGSIVSPKLIDISRNGGIRVYQHYLSILLMDSKTYFAMMKKEEEFELLSDDEKERLNIFDLMTIDKDLINLLQQVLNFFIAENVVFSEEHRAFLVIEKENELEDKLVGVISRESYFETCDLILQRNNIKQKKEDLSKVKSKKALEIMKKLQKGRSEKAKATKSDEKMELGNIISSVANKSNSLNIVNIWDATVYQIWDAFSRLTNNSIYDIQSMSVAAWGDKDKQFDATTWFKRIDTRT